MRLASPGISTSDLVKTPKVETARAIMTKRIIACTPLFNHKKIKMSREDAALLGQRLARLSIYTLKPRPRDICFMADEALIGSSFLGILFRAFSSEPVPR